MSTDDLREQAREWLRQDPDEQTRAELQGVLDANDDAGLADRFGTRLEFGTAGLRGVLGAGPNRMNRAVVIRTAAGLCEYLRANVPDVASRGVAIGYDGRHGSRRFAEDTAEVCAGYGIRAYLATDVTPTPYLAFAVTHLSASAGVMVTASHNPPEYNGYKVYWGNGAQIIPPHDAGIAASIETLGELAKIPRPILKEARAKGLVQDLPTSLETEYLAEVKALARWPGLGTDLKIAYTPLHGVGRRLAEAALRQVGFEHVSVVAEQAEPDGNFPTVAFPNPEEKGAMDLVLALAERESCDLVLANDPDADRLAVATRASDGHWVQLTGNEVGTLLGYYLLADDPRPAAKRVVITSIVSSPCLGAIARELGVRYEEVLTGFKWIANRAMDLEHESGENFVFGYEEALGYTVGTVARDKDGVSGAAIVAEMTAYYRERHQRGLLAQLDEIYRRVGLFVSGQHNATYKGADGAAKILGIMAGFRAAHPRAVGGSNVVRVTDLQSGERWDPATPDTREKVALPASNVIVYALADGSRITLRPSGTEPKIKYYFDVRDPVAAGEAMDGVRARATARLEALKTALVAVAATHDGSGGTTAS